MFDRLGVFGSTFDLAAAEQVVAGDGVERGDVVEVLTGLVDKSLVAAERAAAAASTRYRLLETVRHYARERLAESGETTAVRSRHLARAVDIAQAAERDMDGPDQAAVFGRLEAEHDDLRLALAWGTSGGDPEPALRLATPRPVLGGPRPPQRGPELAGGGAERRRGRRVARPPGRRPQPGGAGAAPG